MSRFIGFLMGIFMLVMSFIVMKSMIYDINTFKQGVIKTLTHQ